MNDRARIPSLLQWTIPGRFLVFFLAAMSIWSLLAEFYGLCSMRTFTLYVLIPATALLIAIALLDRARGDGRLWRMIAIGAVAGFIAACSYDLFRVPFVIAAAEKVGPAWLRLPLYKVFPQFGAMILAQPFTAEQTHFALSAQLVGWAYHFSNGITFGIMYMAMIGDATRRSWLWAVVFAVGLELAMLLTPYAAVFGIALTTAFIAATLMAHLIFGIAMGLYTRWAAAQQVA